MNNEQKKILQYLEGDMNEKERTRFEQLLKESDSLKRQLAQFTSLENELSQIHEYDPPQSAELDFHKILITAKQQKEWQQLFLKVAASLLLVSIGFVIGLSLDSKTSNGLSELQEKVETMEQLMLANSLVRHSASQRLQVIHQVQSLDQSADSSMIEALIQVMLYDESANVRYAACEALERFISHQRVKTAFVKALELERESLVQIEIIQILVQSQEKTGIGAIQDLISRDDTSTEVKKQGAIALDILI